MSTLDQMRDAIHATVSGIPNIGVVHKYERYAKNSRQMLDLYSHQSKVRGWFIRRVSTEESSRHLASGLEIFRWQIRGVMALDDDGESELDFDNLIEQIRDAFRGDESLGGVVDGTVLPGNGEAGIQLLDSGPAMFAGVLVHACRLRLNTVRSY